MTTTIIPVWIYSCVNVLVFVLVVAGCESVERSVGLDVGRNMGQDMGRGWVKGGEGG